MGDAVTYLGLMKPPVGVDHQNVPSLQHNLKAGQRYFSLGKIYQYFSSVKISIFLRKVSPPYLRFSYNPTNILVAGAVSTTYDLLSNPQIF